VSVAPRSRTRLHRHHDCEVFLITRGSGAVSNGRENFIVEEGDVVTFDSYEGHELENTSDHEALHFVSVWWNASGLTPLPALELSPSPAPKALLITSTPPTPNGPLHLGHLSGPYLAASALQHATAQRQRRVSLVSGLDDHQSYVELRAWQDRTTPENVADHYGALIVSTWERYGIHHTAITAPRRQPEYRVALSEFCQRLNEAGLLVAKYVLQPFCGPCDRFLFEAHIRGQCPHCGEICDGNTCEACGIPNDCADLIKAYCRRCGAPPDLRPVDLLYFPLARFARELQRFWSRVTMPPHVRALCRKFLAMGMPDFAVGHPSNWGFPIPVPGFEHHTLYAWFEMTAGYQFLAAQEGMPLVGDGTREFEFVQFFGFDNAFFHAILFPAVWTALDHTVKLPDALCCNEFYLLDQQKFSTSRKHAIWAHEIADSLSTDIVRYHILATRPESRQMNFSLRHFKTAIENSLVTNFSTWVETLDTILHEQFHSESPEAGQWTGDHDAFAGLLADLVQVFDRAYAPQTFSSTEALSSCERLAQAALEFAARFSHAATADSADAAEYRTAIVLQLTALRLYALAVAPIMPQLSQRLALALGEPAALTWEAPLHLFPPHRHIGDLAACGFRHVFTKES